MVDLALLQSVSYIAGALGVCVAAFYYVMNLRITQRNQELNLKAQQQNLETRQAQLFMGMYQSSYTREWSWAYRKTFGLNLKNAIDFEKINDDEETYEAFSIISQYLEGQGVLVREGLVDIRLVSELNSVMITAWWKKFGPGVLQCREKWGFPRYCIEIEYLAKRAVEYGREHPEMGIAPDFESQIGK